MDALAAMQRLANGRLLEELYDALVTTAKEVVETGKPGTVTLTLKVSTQSQGNPMVIIGETIARKAPQKDPRGAYFFALDGALHSNDPRQPQLEFRLVDRETGEIRSLDEAPELLREAK